MRSRLLAVPAALALGLVLTACGSDDDPEPADDAGAGSPDTPAEPAADDGLVTGTEEEWLAAVCPGSDVGDVEDATGRGGPDATGGAYCVDVSNPGAEAFYSVELYRYATDPTAYWEEQAAFEPDNFVYYGLGQVSESEWVVIHEDDSRNEITGSTIAALEPFGFAVVAGG